MNRCFSSGSTWPSTKIYNLSEITSRFAWKNPPIHRIDVDVEVFKIYKKRKKAAPRTSEAPLHPCDPHLCQSLLPLLIHLLSTLSSIHPTTKSHDDPCVLLFLLPCAPSPPSGCLLFQNPLKKKKTSSCHDGKGMKGECILGRGIGLVLNVKLSSCCVGKSNKMEVIWVL